MTLTNPLYAFRVPKGVKNHPHINGTHFNTQRKDVENDTGAYNIYPGMFVYKPDPTLEVDLAIWEDLDDPTTHKRLLDMTTREGFQIAQAKEWQVVDPMAQMVWKKSMGWCLSIGAQAKKRMVLMWRTAEEAEESDRAKRKNIEYINKTPHENHPEMPERLGPLNATVQVTLEDEDASDKAMANYEKRLAAKNL